MGRTIIFVGTPGAGKSTIIAGINHKFKLVNIGSEMLEIEKKDYGVKDRDDLRKLSAEITKKVRNQVFDKIRKEKQDIIIDTHASIRSGPRFVPGFTIEELQSLNELMTIVYIDAESKDILERRKEDFKRRRDVEDSMDLEEQREVNISMITTYAAIMGIPLYMIKNQQGKLERAIKQANDAVKEMFG
ncbi:MAG: AAA family ATPase [Candidatus Micrarchaeota archaeon]|nr:AAA family ATPase [Candidatus Micrarchaeota archaeon]